jgi:hypothetical protein
MTPAHIPATLAGVEISARLHCGDLEGAVALQERTSAAPLAKIKDNTAMDCMDCFIVD